MSGKKWFQISFQTKLWETHDFTKYMMYNNFNWNLGHTRVLTSAPPGSTNIISAYGCVYPNNKVFIKKDVFLWRRYNVCKFHWISMESQQYAKRSWYDVYGYKQFHKIYNQLVVYKNQHGDCMVPVSYEADPSLAPWINKRRIAYKQGDMPDYQITLLDDIGFVWKTDINNPKTSLIQRHWEEYFQRLVKYKQKCGNCRVVYNSEGERSLAVMVGNTTRCSTTRFFTTSTIQTTRRSWISMDCQWQWQYEMFQNLQSYQKQNGWVLLYMKLMNLCSTIMNGGRMRNDGTKNESVNYRNNE